MVRIREIAAIVLALPILGVPATAMAHGEIGDRAAEFQEHMDAYAADIKDLIATADGIVADYKPGNDYADEVDGLIEQWEHVKFHGVVETNATPLYPPIWTAITEFSTSIKEAEPQATVRARADGITAALWQGYGALKLLAVRGGADAGREHASASGGQVISTINTRLGLVLAEYMEGEAEEALELIQDTYLSYFEGIEGDLIEQDADLVSSLEVDFNVTLPQLIKNGAPVERVAAQVEAMKGDLATARELLAEQEESSVF